jgi:hypothetical protein
MKIKIRKYNFLIIIILAATMLMPIAVYAEEVENNPGNKPTVTVQERLTARNLAKCQLREKVMNNIIARIGDRGQKQINVISSIQQKVENFYADKQITVENYDALLKNAQDKQQLATKEMESVRAMNGTFSCIGENPKVVAAQFKNQAATQSAAMKDYRLAVHELAVSVKTALGDSQAVVEEN